MWSRLHGLGSTDVEACFCWAQYSIGKTRYVYDPEKTDIFFTTIQSRVLLLLLHCSSIIILTLKAWEIEIEIEKKEKDDRHRSAQVFWQGEGCKLSMIFKGICILFWQRYLFPPCPLQGLILPTKNRIKSRLNHLNFLILYFCITSKSVNPSTY